MKNVKELFKNARAKIRDSKIATFVKGILSNIKNSKIMTASKTKVNGLKETVKDFTGSHQNIKDSMAGDVSNRFSSKIKKFFKNILKGIQTKSNNGNKFATFVTVTIKVMSIIAAIAFAGLVIYCIKDVFLYCLMLVATCAATVFCIEFILSVLSIATGCKI